MNKAYYLRENDQTIGPFTFNELLQHSINLDTLLTDQPNGKWVAATEYTELANYFQAKGITVINEDALASFWLRLAAYTIDIVAFFLFIMLLAIIYAIAVPNANITETEVQNHTELIQWAGFVFMLLYNSIFEVTPLQGSIGKLLIGLQVVNENGQRLKLGQSFTRNAGRMVLSLILGQISFFAIGISYVYIFLNPYRQALYDRLAKTYIIRKP